VHKKSERVKKTTKQKGIIFATLERFHQLMALHESRYAAKQAMRSLGEPVWSFSTGKIHSLTTRGVYQQQVLAFVNWARATHHITHLELLDIRADELATEYLASQIAQDRSPYTIATQRSALRMFFSNRELASTLVLPERKREQISRSRGVAAQDKEFQPLNWQMEIAFLTACGLRRSEALSLLVTDISLDGGSIYVRQGKGGKARNVPVLPGQEHVILALIQGRHPEEGAFPRRLPVRLDVHALRRTYAQALYLYYAPDRELPPPTGRLASGSYDEVAVRQVSYALGHARLDVVLRHYLR
jgi:integrase